MLCEAKALLASGLARRQEARLQSDSCIQEWRQDLGFSAPDLPGQRAWLRRVPGLLSLGSVGGSSEGRTGVVCERGKRRSWVSLDTGQALSELMLLSQKRL